MAAMAENLPLLANISQSNILHVASIAGVRVVVNSLAALSVSWWRIFNDDSRGYGNDTLAVWWDDEGRDAYNWVMESSSTCSGCWWRYLPAEKPGWFLFVNAFKGDQYTLWNDNGAIFIGKSMNITPQQYSNSHFDSRSKINDLFEVPHGDSIDQRQIRHSGMDCRHPERRTHPANDLPVAWIPALPAGMTRLERRLAAAIC